MRQLPDRRGQYDRRKSPRQRRRQAHSRLIDATARVICETDVEAPNVTQIISLAQVGRNTFYQLFREGKDARRATERTATRVLADAVDRAVRDAVTPIERLRALANAWIELACCDSALIRLAVLAAPSKGPPLASQVLGRRLQLVADAARDQGIVAATPPSSRVAMVVAAWHSAAHQAARNQEGARVLASELVDFTLRAFR